ncbi:tetratricopeptide repeat protein [Allocoleopsis franciscana]|uniref:Tfp pilus assembly protein PilF n=1 Tax=Allocoleopsis franciscana PCC 7113 TaxID=1173027 RepID=K9WDF7_9CYAN|nr:tetratricopeptide repeat protein [Allocoleopsis franciscana]AFZ17784.1 Tfp pilus assembly protein PilF [Allocoleopsis franciscana PCC 7113]
MQSCLDHQAETKFGQHYEQGEEFYRTSSDSDRSQWGQHHHSKRSSYEESAKRHPVSHDRASSLPSTLGTKSTIGHPTAPHTTNALVPRELLSQGSSSPENLGLPQPIERQDHSNQLQATLKTLQQALTIAQGKNNRANQVNIIKRIGIIHCKLGEHAWGINCLKQSLQLAQSLENHVLVGVILNYLGAAYRQTGQEYKALKVYLRALEIFKHIGNKAGIALLLNHLGAVYNSLGQLEQALSCSRQALEEFQDLGNSLDREGTALHNIGEIYLQMKRYRQALAFFEQALTNYQKLSNRKSEAKVLESIATTYVRLNQDQQAMELYQQVWEIRREVGDLPSAEARTIDYIAAVHYKMGHPARAVWYHLQALGILQAYNYTARIDRFLDDTVAIAKLLQNLVSVYERLGLQAQGVKCYQEAQEIIKTFGENACEEAICNFFNQNH